MKDVCNDIYIYIYYIYIYVYMYIYIYIYMCVCIYTAKIGIDQQNSKTFGVKQDLYFI